MLLFIHLKTNFILVFINYDYLINLILPYFLPIRIYSHLVLNFSFKYITLIKVLKNYAIRNTLNI